ncbi:hypothetical protein NDU88_008033, partial [Pleurodeles waltl]
VLVYFSPMEVTERLKLLTKRMFVARPEFCFYIWRADGTQLTVFYPGGCCHSRLVGGRNLMPALPVTQLCLAQPAGTTSLLNKGAHREPARTGSEGKLQNCGQNADMIIKEVGGGSVANPASP